MCFTRDYFLPTELRSRVLQNAGQKQRAVHHDAWFEHEKFSNKTMSK
jgi:hypothetical protein